MKRKWIPLVLLFLVILAFLIIPLAAAGRNMSTIHGSIAPLKVAVPSRNVSSIHGSTVPLKIAATGLTITDGEKIISPYGNTSSVITVTDSDIPDGGTITIDVINTYYLIYSGKFTDANLVITSDAANATWTGSVSSAGDLVTLTSSGGNTSVGENITVTFTGAAGNPWMPGTADIYGDMYLPLTVTRTDTGETAAINFWIETASIPPGGLTITDGVKITSPDGATSPVITIADSDIPAGSIITIAVPDLFLFVKSGTFTDANIIINDTASAATWSGIVSGETGQNKITLTSTGGNTTVGENITVTFTGAEGNPWDSDTSSRFGDMVLPLTVTRTDTFQMAYINFGIETAPPPGGLVVTEGMKITETTGNSSPMITIADSDIAEGGTITVDVSGLNPFVANGFFSNDNVVITSDTAAVWTRDVINDGYGNAYLTLTSTSGNTTIGENITLTFTGVTNPWTPNTYGSQTLSLTATRTDTGQKGMFNFVIETSPPPFGLTIAEGMKITNTTGKTSPVITITESEIVQDSSITIDVSALNAFVAGGILTDSNFGINDTAAAANWTGIIAGDPLTLTLTSTDGPTAVGENVTVTFTGAGGTPWISNTHGNQTVLLTPIRTDGLGFGYTNFIIETAPPSGFLVEANFSSSKAADLAPLTVEFNDTSAGNPTLWSWDFGDGSTSTLQNPSHTYTDIGTYTVILEVSNEYGSDTKIQWDYIHALNGGIHDTNTSIDGIILTSCGSPQAITVDTSILPASLFLNNSVLEIQPPADRGLKNITLYSRNGFSRSSNLIVGIPTSVHIVTEDIAPSQGFLGTVGTNASFNFSIDLPYYPCDAVFSTKIWEGVMPEYDNKFRQIVDKNNGSVVGTAYTANITKINFLPGAVVKIHMSVNPDWNTYPNLPGGPGMMFIWRIADDGNSGQILPTTFLNTDQVNNLAYYEADSPQGMSTFGLSSLSGNNNPFQIIAFVATNVISPSNNPASVAIGEGGKGGGSSSAQTVASGAPAVPDQIKPAETLMETAPMEIAPTPEPTILIASKSSMETNVQMYGWLFGMIAQNPVTIVVLGAVLALIIYFGWWKRRL
jgi:PKD repeat protein